jgi:hypothetical protein
LIDDDAVGIGAPRRPNHAALSIQYLKFHKGAAETNP